MSVRVRVLLLVLLVALAAVGATAYLTVRQLSTQLNRSVSSDQASANRIAEDLRHYGVEHGTWEGIAALAGSLNRGTGLRIKLITEFGETIVDTDTLARRTARRTPAPPILVDPRPAISPAADGGNLHEVVRAIDQYRRGVRLAACLTRGGGRAELAEGSIGTPLYRTAAATDPALAKRCDAEAISAASERAADEEAALACVQRAKTGSMDPSGTPALPSQFTTCVKEAFQRRVERVGPVPLLLYLGATDDPVRLATTPIVAAAVAVFLLALVGALLLSRHVVRPVAALTAASRRLGQGDLSSRVPVSGSDEIAALGRSFNRMADSLQAAEERQRRLVADVAHELRTPLANLRGYLEALKDDVIAPSPDLFASLHDEAVLQQRIVDDLQDLAQAEAGTLVYHMAPVDAADLLEACRTAHQAVADAAGVRLNLHAADPLPVHVDPDRIRQVIGNLVTNAVRATAPGGEVTLSGQAVPGGAVLRVADTGHGIAPDDLPHLFDRFWRADAARGRRTGGSGLGLAIAKEIVAAHGGTIEAASRVNAGTTFTIRLPA
ncbi:sensor histidine kinase [Rhizomonospora bruguierae]|uniref:sensor histidine kinase n=1 Tax=Rhizomonospora bruguierae TaxID=1581705 RepID=UPI001BCDE2EE|nr:ATP-binding protein [Micromonospora sp. NBRC 107566]